MEQPEARRWKLPGGEPLELLHAPGIVGLVFNQIEPFTLAEAVDAVVDLVEAADHALALCRLDARRPDALRRFIRLHNPAALILTPDLAEANAVKAVANELDCPCLVTGNTDPDALHVERMAMMGLVSWIISRGHSRIGFVSDQEDSRRGRQRMLGYLDAMAEYGLDRGPMLIEDGDGSAASGTVASRVLLEISPRPSAIVAANDEMALGALQAAAQMNLQVPDDVSVAGFGNTRAAADSHPPLATVDLPWRKATRQAVIRLLDPDDDDDGPILAEPRIFPRASVADRIGQPHPNG
jgi:LacI family transcriptional regulator